MQTFLPYPDLRSSSQLLDTARLGKQRVETFQILRSLTWPEYAWKNHPAVRMWRGFVPALVAYGVENCREWVRRGHRDSVLPQLLEWSGGTPPLEPELPPWWGRADLHLSHRARLVHKDPQHYLPLFGPLPDLPYVWPAAPFPRWPLRRGGRALDVEGAGRELDLEPHPWQRTAVRALAQGHDVLLVAAPGAGGTTTALLAGLALPGPTLRLLPGAHPASPPVPPVDLPAARPEPEQAPWASEVSAGTRTASPAARAAMTAEAGPPEWHLRSPGDVDAAHLVGAGLVSVEGATAAEDPRLPAALAARGAGGPPLLVRLEQADAAHRHALGDRLGLRAPVHLGAGWDVAAHLDAHVAGSVAARRALLVEVVGRARSLVLAADRGRAERAVGSLQAAGLRAALWTPTLRSTRAAAATAAWRSRRLDALVVPEGPLPELGRARVPQLVGLDVLGSPAAWRGCVDEVAPHDAVLLAGPDAAVTLRAWAAGGTCLRERLLAPFGEPVTTPCGRCARCATAPAG